MRRSGKISLLSLFMVLVIVMVAVVLLFSKQGPQQAGGEFMDALVRGDVNQLTNLSYLGNTPNDEVKKEWEFSTQVAGKHYNFQWKITAATTLNDTGSVNMQVVRNFGSPAAYPENFALPMVLVNGQWKVDVGNLSHELYPGLPKGTS